jgi:heterotetrameric sarcosine oxidase gamma subunit
MAAAPGARSEQRDGWVLAAGGPGFTDRSNMFKAEVWGAHELTPGQAVRDDEGVWRCPVTPDRMLVLAEVFVDGFASILEANPSTAVDLTCAHVAVELAGPNANEVLARFCAIDVRPKVMPVGAFRPGSVARTPGYVLRTAPDSLLILTGWAFGEYLWQVVADAAGVLNA